MSETPQEKLWPINWKHNMFLKILLLIPPIILLGNFLLFLIKMMIYGQIEVEGPRFIIGTYGLFILIPSLYAAFLFNKIISKKKMEKFDKADRTFAMACLVSFAIIVLLFLEDTGYLYIFK